MIPISKNIIEPQTINACLYFVDSIEQFEAIEIFPNQAIIGFDNNRQCFYEKERDKYGEYSRIKIYYYQTFVEKVQDLKKLEFIEKCKNAKLDELETEIAIMFFIDNIKPREVWLKLLERGISYDWDYLRTKKNRLRIKLHIEVAKKHNQIDYDLMPF